MLKIGLAVLSGILIGTSYIPFPPWALCFCLVPLWVQWIRDPRPKSVFFHGWITQFVLTLIGFNWVAFTAVEYGHLPWPVGVLTLLGFSMLFHWHVPVSGLLWAILHKRWPFRHSVLFLAFSFVLFEGLWPMIFPWNLGYPWLWARSPVFQWADVVGFQGLSVLTVLLNVFIFQAWKSRKSWRPALAWAGGACCTVILLSVAGSTRGESWKTADGHLHILAVQANIGNLEKYWQDKGDKYQDVIIQKYEDIAEQALLKHPEPDIIFFPETAIPIDLDASFSSYRLYAPFMSFVRQHGKTVLTGAYSQDPGTDRVYNALFLIGPDGNVLEIYRKTILLAFGEYFPGAEMFPFLKKIVPAISDFGHGSGPMVFKYGDLGLGMQICYEGLYPDFSRQLSAKGASLFLNATNDSWFGTRAEPFQHKIMTLGRAIEFRRPLLRVTNTGISSGMLADGTELESSPFMTEWFSSYTIPYQKRPAPTPFEKWGGFLPWGLLFAMGLTFFWGRRARTKTH